MSISMKTIALGAGLMAGVAAHADMKDECPAEMVNFWKNFAVNTDNYTAIPVFLIQNECFRARISTDFHTAMQKRFDYPLEQKYVDQLYSQLDWGKTLASAR